MTGLEQGQDFETQTDIVMAGGVSNCGNLLLLSFQRGGAGDGDGDNVIVVALGGNLLVLPFHQHHVSRRDSSRPSFIQSLLLL